MKIYRMAGILSLLLCSICLASYTEDDLTTLFSPSSGDTGTSLAPAHPNGATFTGMQAYVPSTGDLMKLGPVTSFGQITQGTTLSYTGSKAATVNGQTVTITAESIHSGGGYSLKMLLSGVNFSNTYAVGNVSEYWQPVSGTCSGTSASDCFNGCGTGEIQNSTSSATNSAPYYGPATYVACYQGGAFNTSILSYFWGPTAAKKAKWVFNSGMGPSLYEFCYDVTDSSTCTFHSIDEQEQD